MDESEQQHSVPDDADSDQPTAAERPTGSGRRGARIARRSVLAVVSTVVLGVTAVGWVVLDHLNQASTAKVLADVPQTPPVDDGATDVLLVGSDSRTDAQGNPLPLSVLKQLRTESTTGLNTDSLVVIRIPRNGAPSTAVSIPRDTYAAVPGGRSEKINAVYGLTKRSAKDRLTGQGVPETDAERESTLAGQRALVQTVQALTGMHIDHYAEVNLLGFYEITNAVGGVDVCLRQATSDKDSGADFAAGRQTISGGDALAFVRQRHGLPRGDLDRIVRQQVFMASLANKVLSTGTLTDTARMNHLVHAAQQAVVLDDGWDVMAFVEQMQQLATGHVTFMTMPVAAAPSRDDRGQSILAVDPEAVHRFFAGLNAPSSAPAPRMGPEPALRLDGAAHSDEPPITSDGGVPCVN
ncbi:LCP family protein [Saccharopolyspora rosea]|uniref:LCP family protein n=1 Tax=Saccharopolyspora rosea TaxID=524884 RepID=A0ABW3G062_9PSEU|nr:LCP family protein [Saccharopolyspora rosea]